MIWIDSRRSTNPNENALKSRRWREEHPGYDAAKARDYQRRHREANAIRAKAWRLANPERYKANIARWHAAHPEERMAHGIKRQRALKTTAITFVNVDEIYIRERGRCHICRCKVHRELVTLDHLVPLSRGGSHVAANVRIAHRACNSVRHNRGAAQLLLDFQQEG